MISTRSFLTLAKACSDYWVLTHPGSHGIFERNFPGLESHGKWLWSRKVM